jgi:hypothetical protein
MRTSKWHQVVVASLAAATILVLGPGAWVTPASAGHFHSYANSLCAVPIAHGFEHGSSTIDKWFWARINGGTCGYHKVCATKEYNASGWIQYLESWGVDTTCQASSHQQVSAECKGQTWLRAESPEGNQFFDPHHHFRHTLPAPC